MIRARRWNKRNGISSKVVSTLLIAFLILGVAGGYYFGRLQNPGITSTQTTTIIQTFTSTQTITSIITNTTEPQPQVMNVSCSTTTTATATTVPFVMGNSSSTMVVAPLLCASTAQFVVACFCASAVSAADSSIILTGPSLQGSCAGKNISVALTQSAWQLAADFSSCQHTGTSAIQTGDRYGYHVTVVSNPPPSPAIESEVVFTGSVVAQ